MGQSSGFWTGWAGCAAGRPGPTGEFQLVFVEVVVTGEKSSLGALAYNALA